MKVSAFGFMPVTYVKAETKSVVIDGIIYYVCVYLNNAKEILRRYTSLNVISEMTPGEEYLVSFNIEANTHRFFVVSQYPPKSLVSIERRKDDEEGS